MANEFWNVIVGFVAAFIMGMIFHSAFRHTYDDLFDRLLHKDKKPFCFGILSGVKPYPCSECKYIKGCYDKYRISTE